MEVTRVRLEKAVGQEPVLATGSITLDNKFVIRGIAVAHAPDGELSVEFPARENKEGDLVDVCFPLRRDLREDIEEKVLSEYMSL